MVRHLFFRDLFLGFMALVYVLRLFSAPASAAEPSTEAYKVGQVQVWAVADSTGDRDMDVFQNASPTLLKRYAPSGTSPSAVMTFVVKTGDRTILIDTGFGNPASALIPGLAKIGVTPADITEVLLTHMHGDHIGGLALEGKRAFPSAKILIGRVEHTFWLDPKSLERFPERKANLEAARRMMDLYGDAVQVFDFDAAVVPGIQALDAHGHTPGHTAFLLESDGEKLLFWGDLVHSAALQFPRPEINARYDMYPDKAAKARAAFMQKAAEEKLPIAGSHLPFPAVGRVGIGEKGGYTYTPGL